MNIRDVAQRAGVSISTVSRVLNDTGYPVKPETRQRVLEAVEELGFRPNDLARGLHLKRTRTVGLVIPDITNPYYPELALGVEATASGEGYSVIFCNTNRRAEKLEHYVDVLLQKRADGIIIAGGGTDFSPVSQVLSDFDIEAAVIGRHNLPFPSVQIDNVGAAYEATSHLVELGHERIAFISGPLSLTSVQDRLNGYREALRRRGIERDDRLVREGDFQPESGYSAARSLLQGSVRPTAIFAANDRMAIGAMAAAFDLGMEVPEEVSIVGFDDITMASYVRPALTTVSLPGYEMGASAMRLILKLISGKECPRVTWLPAELVVRDSSGPPPRSDGSPIRKGGVEDKI
ncbi:LacI family transcriptional regulator [Rubrobacter taiwanensis]|uniref:LacI family transcriptional regulator n=1 Tax=Rubrobacter taiwanensis TaxID=185139 RepID=A0A4R1BER5_9ACTN|nr:LacI family DNA-binding transcriptional regulator [Rubrobacter taiwanensis]TCJ15621.1 LacI family transcriptional regulator [Rubrobacter taiwanensis]